MHTSSLLNHHIILDLLLVSNLRILNIYNVVSMYLLLGGRHISVVSSAPTILRPRVRIPSTPSTLFSICIEIVSRKERKQTKKRPGLARFFLKKSMYLLSQPDSNPIWKLLILMPIRAVKQGKVPNHRSVIIFAD